MSDLTTLFLAFKDTVCVWVCVRDNSRNKGLPDLEDNSILLLHIEGGFEFTQI